MTSTPIPSIPELRTRCQKPLTFERVAFARFTRRYSIYLTWVLLHTPVTPNQVTMTQLLWYVIGSTMIAFGSMGWVIAGLLFLHVGYALDCVDGEIARFRGIASRMGVFLDSFTHVFTIPLIIFAFSVHVAFAGSWGVLPVLVGFFTATLAISPAKYARILTRSYLAERKENPAYNPAVLRDDSRLDASLASVRPGMRGIMSLLKTTSEFPASMNIITIVLILDAFAPMATVAFAVLSAYTLLLIARECYVLYRVYRGHEPLDAPADLF